jgi:hypothetical protein
MKACDPGHRGQAPSGPSELEITNEIASLAKLYPNFESTHFIREADLGTLLATMSTLVQAATTTYASRIKTGNTPLIIPSPALLARNKSLVTGTPLAAPPTLQTRPSFRSSTSRVNGDGEDDDDDEDFLDVESDEGKKDKEEDDVEESGGFVQGPPPDALIQKRNAQPTRHVYRYSMGVKGD